MHPVKIQIRAVWSESSLYAFWIAKDSKFLHGGHENSDQTVRMRRLISAFVGHTYQEARFLMLRLNNFQSTIPFNKIKGRLDVTK